jgi:assimilatory nitrate reductase catalytic subunit
LYAKLSSEPAACSLDAAAGRFQPASWDEALDFTVQRMREIQAKYGNDAIAVFGGASLSTEKS